MKSSFFVLLFLLVASCRGGNLGGGGSGNGTKFNTDGLMKLGAGKILLSICNKMDGCQGSMNEEFCRENVAALTTINAQLGVSFGFKNFGEFIAAEQNKKAKTNASEVNKCSAAVDEFKCNDPVVLAAYNPN